MIQQQDIAALKELISYLDVSPQLSRERELQLCKRHMAAVTALMVDTGVSYGVASGGLVFLNQPEDKFREHLRSIDNDLGEQIRIVKETVERWFKCGEHPAPYYPWRITVILRKARSYEEEAAFLKAYSRHFFPERGSARDMKLKERAIKIGVAPLSRDETILQSLQSQVPLLEVTMKSAVPIGDSKTELYCTCEFHCRSCGGYLIHVPDDAIDETIVSCTACGEKLGEWRHVNALAMHVGTMEMKRLRIGGYADSSTS